MNLAPDYAIGWGTLALIAVLKDAISSMRRMHPLAARHSG